MKYLLLYFTLVFSSKACAQYYKTEAECIRNRDIEKNLVTTNKIQKIELVHFVWDKAKKNWRPTHKNVYYFNSLGQYVKMTLHNIDLNGNETEYWSGVYVYNSSGLCDSLPTDKGPKQKASSPLAQYPTCYKHLGNKKLKDGLTIKGKNKRISRTITGKGKHTKLVDHFIY